ncbi:GTP cyclohydrolase I FolE [Helicobacter sp. 16-1353]|uniref:GTP cyclohydrolase I FolE n=1 Tax=Helicobacter sp. 16-1353 TaxID=2004996 RepID=UPI000DCE0BA7|nr:GTP cyclohydrolase I FolE [Helicobacter sp. 16-1353]RAX54240.1 GTP cyclohydrolase I FolE [Helicobacter sp. 16-1353]
MENFFIDFFKIIGEDSQREGLKNTPNRVIKSWEQLYSGYLKNPKDILQTTFSEGSCDEMVVLKNIEFYSMCEHHILPFFGTISLGYIPDKKLIGISKLVQVVEIFSRRLQIQENLTTQIADTLMEELKPQGVMVVTEATHLCMIMQGIEKKNATLITSAVRGTFKKDARSRAEFMEHIK